MTTASAVLSIGNIQRRHLASHVAIASGASHRVTRLEAYGEGTLLIYYRPDLEVGAGLAGLGGRYHLWPHRVWTPYVTVAAGLIWTSLNIPELDRRANFQLLYGVGLRVARQHGPGWIVELRNHHISNAGTAGENLGLNTIAVVAGVQWILRR